MRIRLAISLVATLAVAISTSTASSMAAVPPGAGVGTDPIVVVLDTSGSMADEDGNGRVKIDGAKTALLNFLKSVEPGTPIGLRTFPGDSGSSCDAGKLRFDVEPRDPAGMTAQIRSLVAEGDTPMAEAMLRGVQDLRDAGYTHGTLVLVSDGEPTCEDPCPVARQIAQSGIALNAITVGFKISDTGRKNLQCVADAMNGEYVDADNADALADTFHDISQPTLSVTATYPRKVVAEVGNDPGGLVRVTATIRNTGNATSARGVIARFRFDGQSPGISRPIVHVGNLDPGGERAVDWTFRPSLILAGATLRFSVIVSGTNVRDDVTAAGKILIVDRQRAADAGPILKRKGMLAILGDSYSAGEGTNDYLHGTDTKRDSCHRSRKTYLVPEFHIADDHILACSGAVTADIGAPNEGNHVDSQLQQLDDLQRSSSTPVSGVVMTLGGNDAGFREVATTCLLLTDCNKRIYPSVLPVHGTETQKFISDHESQLKENLVSSYVGIDRVLNTRERVHSRGGMAPILVLAYPVPLPLTIRRCLTFMNLSQAEIDLLFRFATDLNGIVEGAARAARERYGAAVFFVPNTEEAFLPDHSLCSPTPYARGLEEFRLAGVDWMGILKDGVTDALYPAGLRWPKTSPAEAWDIFERSCQQLAHPNADGYAAETAAIIRWSLSQDAKLDLDFLDRAQPRDPSQMAQWTTSDVDLGQLAPSQLPQLQGGTSYPLTLEGFVPGTSAAVILHSQLRVLRTTTADRDGELHTTVPIFRGVSGHHTIEIVGAGANGRLRRVLIPVAVHQRARVSAIDRAGEGAAGFGVISLLAMLGSVLVTRRRR